MRIIIMASITAVVVIAVLAGTLIPILDDATATEDTYANEGYYYMTDLGEESIVYVYDGTKWTINGEESNIVISDSTTVIAAENVIVRANGQIRGSSVISPASMTITVTANGITGTGLRLDSTSVTINIAATVYYCAVNEDTGHVLSKYNVPAYLKGDSQILADGLSGYAGGSSGVFRIEGSIDDGFTVTSQVSGITITDVVCHKTEVAGHIDLYSVDSITFTSTYDSGTPDDPSDDVARSQTYSSYVVPYEVSSERSVHFTDGENAIFNAIPVMVIIALLLGVVALIVRSRMD